MRVDAHMHFWRFDPAEYPWIGSEPVLRQDRLPADALGLLKSHDIDACVAVQARTTEGETTYLLELAAAFPWIRAVIGWTDLCDPLLPSRLAEWSADSRLAGFRYVLQHDPGAAELVSSAPFRAGVRALQQRSLLYELLVTVGQLAFMFDFCRANDEHWLVLDHLGKPDIRKRQLRTWIDRVVPIAKLPHVVCKLSGWITEANDAAGEFDGRHIEEYFDAALDLFGPERLMFGSDWPVCLLVSPYARTVQVVERWASKLSRSEQAMIWGANATRVYGIKDHLRTTGG